MMAHFKLTFDDAYSETRQRLLALASGSADASKWSAEAIKRRLNMKHVEWLSWVQNLDPQFGTKRATLTVTGINDTYSEYTADLPEDFRAAWQLYKVISDDPPKRVPVELIAPREEAEYSYPTTFSYRTSSVLQVYRAFIEQVGTDNLVFFVREGAASGTNYVGSYELRYYYYPTELETGQSPAHTSLLPPEMDPIWIDDSARSLMADGGAVAEARQLAELTQERVREMRAIYKKKDSVRQVQIRDVMGYGTGRRGRTWRL